MFDVKIIKALIKGLMTYIPGIAPIIDKKKLSTRHSGAQAEFCYTLWLSILTLFSDKGIQHKFSAIGEIGNGGSLGVGICALLTGCEKYYSLEIDHILDKNLNLNILDELVVLFKNKTCISDKYKKLNIKANSYEYPESLIEPLFLNEKFIEEIRADIINEFKNSKRLMIVKNWHSHSALNLDFIFSRAVMEHVLLPKNVYFGSATHLKVGSFMFHDIEFHSHGITKRIDGHFLIPGNLWKIIFGKRLYFLNRWSLNEHLTCITNNGFKIIQVEENYTNDSNTPEKILYGAIVLAKRENGF